MRLSLTNNNGGKRPSPREKLRSPQDHRSKGASALESRLGKGKPSQRTNPFCTKAQRGNRHSVADGEKTRLFKPTLICLLGEEKSENSGKRLPRSDRANKRTPISPRKTVQHTSRKCSITLLPFEKVRQDKKANRRKKRREKLIQTRSGGRELSETVNSPREPQERRKVYRTTGTKLFRTLRQTACKK